MSEPTVRKIDFFGGLHGNFLELVVNCWIDKNQYDVNDAVKQFGRLATLIHIMQARETSKIKIELRKRQLAKRS